jgi:hypothetical protein
MEELEMEQNSFDILMILKKVCDFTIPKRESMQWEWFSTKKKKPS